MWSRTIYSLSVIIVFGFACADRDRLNPLDPQNPNTFGQPGGLRLSSSRDTVSLRWDRFDLDDLIAVQVYRKLENQSEFVPLARVAPNSGRFKDTNVSFGVGHSYQISGIGDDFESLRSETVQVEPGPAFNWVADNFGRILLKLSHDSRSSLSNTFGFITAVDIEPNPLTGEVWVLDLVNSQRGDVVRVSSDGDVIQPLIPLKTPTDAALNNSSGVLWVADPGDSSLIKIAPDGQVLLQVKKFIEPFAVSVDQSSGICWVADRGLNQVFQVNDDGTLGPAAAEQFRSLQFVSATSVTASAWVSDSVSVIKLGPSGTVEMALAEQFIHAFKIAVNELNGDVWVLDWGSSSVLKYLATGERLFEVEGVVNPRDLSINLFDGSCLVADTGNDRVLWISSSGERVRSVQEIRQPIALGVQNQQ